MHIDFGDCFEASMNREKFPEKVGLFLPNSLDLKLNSNLLLICVLLLCRVSFLPAMSLTWLSYLQVPFRLTRMLVKAMEVSGIEGNFRSTCESVMQVLRTNKDSVMAMMEAFVHDPLINWRLFTLPEVPHVPGRSTATGNPDEVNGISNLPSPPQRREREKELLQVRLHDNHYSDQC